MADCLLHVQVRFLIPNINTYKHRSLFCFYSGDIEFLLNIGKYHVTSKCTHQTDVLWIHKAHFERLFRRRNAHCLKDMFRTVALQLTGRTSREGLLKRAPFFRCLILKLQEVNGERSRPKEEEASNLPHVNNDNVLTRQRSYSEMGHRSPEVLRRSVRTQAALPDSAMFKSPQMPSMNPSHFTPITVSAPNGRQDSSKSDITFVERPLSNPREGIFVKLMHMSNPEVTPSHLAIDEEEFEYLSQLRRRIAKEFQDFSLGDKTPYSESRQGTIQRPCRSGSQATTRKIAKKMFPMLLNNRTAGVSSNIPNQNGVRLPQF